jgi:hypothetical protein
MKHYLLSIVQPDGPIPSPEVLATIMHDVDAVLREAKDSGAWVFNGALAPPASSTMVRVQDGNVLVTDGPFAEGKEHVGGFLVVRAPDLDAALAWGKKLARAVTLPIEVRPFQGDR